MVEAGSCQSLGSPGGLTTNPDLNVIPINTVNFVKGPKQPLLSIVTGGDSQHTEPNILSQEKNELA